MTSTNLIQGIDLRRRPIHQVINRPAITVQGFLDCRLVAFYILATGRDLTEQILQPQEVADTLVELRDVAQRIGQHVHLPVAVLALARVVARPLSRT